MDIDTLFCPQCGSKEFVINSRSIYVDNMYLTEFDNQINVTIILTCKDCERISRFIFLINQGEFKPYINPC